MKKILERVKSSKGYISMETVLVSGLVIGLALLTIIGYQTRANNITKSSLTNVESANNNYKVIGPQ